MHARYQEWLAHVFDHTPTKNGWYFDNPTEEFEASPLDLTLLITQTCTNAERDLAGFSNSQVAQGLNYIFNNSCSNVIFGPKDKKVNTVTRCECIQSVIYLYEGCFKKRCSPQLSHLDEARKSPLNIVCYMLWDVSPLANWHGDKEKKTFHSTLVDLHTAVLKLGHDACTESALHGLGHLHSYLAKPVENAVDNWLRQNGSARTELLHYAKAARNGHVL
ncbi:MAG: hypothetical protein IPK82_24290 [Polyangiaceae bacterium]|nr:hypothetical protein [Polyangiaceae bacterium]